jgi:hypothetical protein
MLVLRIIAAHFIVFTALALVPNSWAQDSKCISVRVLNARSGKPIRGVRVDMFPDRLGNVGQYDLKTSLGKTDRNSTLQYCPSDPALKTFTLSLYQIGSGSGGPEAVHRFNLAQVLMYGAVGYYETPPTGFKDRARPGEILVFGRRWKFLDRILPEME